MTNDTTTPAAAQTTCTCEIPWTGTDPACRACNATPAGPFALFLPRFSRWLDGFETFEAAAAKARQIGFDSVIWEMGAGDAVGSFTTATGVRDHRA